MKSNLSGTDGVVSFRDVDSALWSAQHPLSWQPWESLSGPLQLPKHFACNTFLPLRSFFRWWKPCGCLINIIMKNNNIYLRSHREARKLSDAKGWNLQSPIAKQEPSATAHSPRQAVLGAFKWEAGRWPPPETEEGIHKTLRQIWFLVLNCSLSKENRYFSKNNTIHHEICTGAWSHLFTYSHKIQQWKWVLKTRKYIFNPHFTFAYLISTVLMLQLGLREFTAVWSVVQPLSLSVTLCKMG